MAMIWVICGKCAGNGKHSQNLGAYSVEEFQREFDEEEQEMYFAGAYDSCCEECEGSGKLLVDPAEAEEDDGAWESEAAMRRAEMGE